MNWIDISILVVVLLSVVIGIFRGFVKEVLSLINWGTAVFASIYFHESAQQYLKGSIDSQTASSIAAFVAVFLVFLILGSLITHFIGYLVKKSGLGGTDRMLGLMFGFVRGVMVSAVLLAAISFTPVKSQKIWQDAIILPTFKPIVAWLNTNISEHMTETFDENKKAATEQAIQRASQLKTIQELLDEEKNALPS